MDGVSFLVVGLVTGSVFVLPIANFLKSDYQKKIDEKERKITDLQTNLNSMLMKSQSRNSEIEKLTIALKRAEQKLSSLKQVKKEEPKQTVSRLNTQVKILKVVDLKTVIVKIVDSEVVVKVKIKNSSKEETKDSLRNLKKKLWDNKDKIYLDDEGFLCDIAGNSFVAE